MLRNKIKILAIIFSITVILLLFNDNIKSNVFRSKFKRYAFKDKHFEEMELLLNPTQSNDQKSVCKLPIFKLEGHNSIEKYKPCKQKTGEWGYFKLNHWNLNHTVVKNIKQLKCQYRTVYRENDFELLYTNKAPLEDKQLITHDTIEVTCAGNLNDTKKSFNHVYAQIVPKETTKIGSKYKDSKPLNIILLGYDSISRVSWFKRLPKTTNFLINDMKFNILYGNNFLGGGTPGFMIPFLTGKTEEELPSTLKSDPNGSYVDQAYPFIWKDLHPKGYMSLYMEDWPQVSTFTYRLRGMSNQSAHHHMRAYQQSVWNRVSHSYYSNSDDLCYGSIKRHTRSLNLITEFIETYKNKSKNYISMVHLTEFSHDGNQRANQIDSDLLKFLETNNKKDNFKNTAIFLYSDHGRIFGADRASRQGFLEERQPFFSLYLPPEYKKAHPTKYQNLLKNSQQITTAFDLHETIRDLTNLPSKKSARSISVLDEIPTSRTCEEMGISFHYCVCQQEWTKINIDNEMIMKAAKFTIDYINKLLSQRSEFCHILKLKKILKAKKAVINKDIYYKLHFITNPNEGEYESLIRIVKGNFSIKSPTSIDRINPYGTQPKCLDKAPPDSQVTADLRSFCYCYLTIRL